MTVLLNGKIVSQRILNAVIDEVSGLEKAPCLSTIIVGDDPASKAYVARKKKVCEKVGIRPEVYHLSKDSSQKDIEDVVKELNKNDEVTGILVQSPLPKHIDKYAVSDLIDPLKDVDCFNSYNVLRLYRGQECLEPCTPKGILSLLKYYQIQTEGKYVVIVGDSDIVGKPLSLMLGEGRGDATVTVCHKATQDLKKYTSLADILVSAAGEPYLIKDDMVKDQAVVIDVGMNWYNSSLVGDVDFEFVKRKASYITPVPGGVGPMTVASLVENVLKAYKLQNH